MTDRAPAPRLAVPEDIAPGALRGFDRAAPVIDLDGETMGTRWRVRLALPAGTEPATIQRAVQTRLDGIVAQMSHWEPSSLLCSFNSAENGSWTHLPSDFAQVVACALRIAEASDGAFDPAGGRLTDAWGLGPRKTMTPPSKTDLDEALAHSGWLQLAFDAETNRLRQPGGIWLDLSGIAKGFAADAVALTLSGFYIYHALIEVGGEFVGRGVRPDGDPWWVDMETPEQFELPSLRVALHQLAVATSGDYVRGAHTLNMASGLPAIHETTAVSVIHVSCMEADAWATALTVLPPDRAKVLAEKNGLAVRLVARDGTEWLSTGLRTML